ncbi:MAG: hypothetical protein KJ990_10705 [Proteobacteria bacterium]|nr:hypothetical protein [Pseudomonadota bacterium]MBU1650506.1 hypothetical protein [Pseudomonadota bacterium]
MRIFKVSSLAGARIYVLYALLFFFLLFVFQNFIVVLFASQGYPDNLAVGNIPVSLLLIVLCVSCIRRPEMPSYFFLHLGLSLLITPSLVLYCGGSLPISFALTSVSAFLIIAITTIFFDIRRIKLKRVTSKQLLILLTGLSLAFIGSIFVFGGARFINFDFSRVYGIRSDAAENLPGIFGYLSPLFGKVIIPFATVLSILWRRWSMVAILVGCSVLLFALTAHKAPLFYPFIVLFVFWVAQSSSKAVELLLIAILGILAISSIDFWLYTNGKESMMFGSLFARRVILVPSLLNWFYFDWFSMHEKYYWAGSKLTLGLIAPPESLSAVNLIGLEYFNNEEMSANTGWIGSGYANAGLFGVYLYSVLIGLFFSFLNVYGRKLGARLVIALFTLPVLVMLRSTDLTTMLLTHGLLIAMGILMILRPEGPSPEKVAS